MKFTVFLLEEVEKFILSLPLKMQAKIQRTIDLLRDFGYKLPMPHAKLLVESRQLKELRIQQGSDICRLFYFHYQEKTYVITSGYIKKENKTDKNEIKKAIMLMERIKEKENV
ncbi:type II toxin-antitoxin system RelE/ParE family toxin [bacterium]|jgi:phage-related protein|nr:type II toxin-antitoxin system RelE/ParE family toxin [bacterium]